MTETYMVRAMHGVHLRQKRFTGLMFMLGLKETMANNVCWHSHVLRTDDSHITRF